MSSSAVLPETTTATDAFATRLIGMLNDANLAMMISIGHRTRLFDTMSGMSPATSQQIADQAGLQERYVREWLGAMVTGLIVNYDPAARTYHLPTEKAALLTRAASPNNLASMMQFVSVLGGVEDEVVECFHKGGGVHYCSYDRFHEVMAEESAQTVVAGLFDHILPLVAGLRERLEEGIDVLDVGCGAGRALAVLAEAFPKSRFVGLDFSEEAIGIANAQAQEKGLSNLRFEAKDVTVIGQPEAYDLITAFDAIHDQTYPDRVLREIRQALRPDGVFLMQDIAASSFLEKNMDNPLAPMFYTISTMHCMTVSLANGGAGLGTAWGEELACQMVRDAGFRSVDVERLPHDIQNNFYIVRP